MELQGAEAYVKTFVHNRSRVPIAVNTKCKAERNIMKLNLSISVMYFKHITIPTTDSCKIPNQLGKYKDNEA